jgi:hypothetical protein
MREELIIDKKNSAAFWVFILNFQFFKELVES